MEIRAQIAAALRENRSALLVNHVEPDGDCLGSTLALALALREIGVTVVVGSDGGVPAAYAFLPGADRVVTAVPDDARFDAAVAMECSTLERCGVFSSAVARAPLIVTIDHHQSAVPFGHLNDLDPAAAAAGEQVADLIPRLGVTISPAIATCLMTAVATDTGVFRFPTVRPQTLRLAADLLEAGGEIAPIVRQVYESRTPGALRLLGLVLSQMTVALGGLVAYGAVTDAMRRQSGAGPEDASGIVGVLRGTAGVRVALLFEEWRPAPDRRQASQWRPAPDRRQANQTGAGTRVSIRTRDGPRAHVIAEAFGGGGHQGAAGCTVVAGMDEAISRVLAQVSRELAVETPAPATVGE